MRSTGWSADTVMWDIRESIRRSTAAGSPPSRGAKRCPVCKRKIGEEQAFAEKALAFLG